MEPLDWSLLGFIAVPVLLCGLLLREVWGMPNSASKLVSLMGGTGLTAAALLRVSEVPGQLLLAVGTVALFSGLFIGAVLGGILDLLWMNGRSRD